METDDLGPVRSQLGVLWIRIRRQVMGVCYRLPNQEEEIDEAFFRQLEETLYLQTPVLMGDFNHPSVRITKGVKIRDNRGRSDGGVQNPESRVQGNKQDHNS